MLKYIKFDGKTTYMFPNGAIATPDDIRRDFPAVDVFPHILEINGNVCQAVMELAATRQMYNIDDALTDDEAITELEKIRNAPPPEPEASAEDRIAASLEYQNLMNY